MPASALNGGAGTCGGFVVAWIVRGWFGAEVSLAGAVRVGGVARGIRGCILNDISFAEFWQVRFRYQTLGSFKKVPNGIFRFGTFTCFLIVIPKN